MQELKPVAWMYEKQIERIDEPTQVVTPYENPSLVHGEYPWTQTLLYAIPATHRIVPVELLERILQENYLRPDESEACIELVAIIDKEPT